LWETLAPLSISDTSDLAATSMLGLRRSDVLAAAHTAALESGDPVRVKRVLRGPLDDETAPRVVALLGWDQVAPQARAALEAYAKRCTPMLVERLLDQTTEFVVRRRLPAILEAGDAALAIPGLWRGLGDPRFEVRYRCAKTLARLRASGHELGLADADVLAAIERELGVDRQIWQGHRLIDPASDPAAPADDDLLDQLLGDAGSRGLDHVFTLLGLSFPAEPMRIALHGLHTDDRALRGTALEYLESVLPSSLRATLWPYLEPERAARTSGPSRDALEQLKSSLPSIREHLRARSRS
jgi:hypothetical protein